ncbi:hypothetical protein GW17_00026184 [Ensete ventricosum]|nr:hypothetical protein GW17_00026184 [Ensete ventricosum]RZS10773.1 hypothetical protein BHM03_00042041 [Ensete ventricosum]
MAATVGAEGSSDNAVVRGRGLGVARKMRLQWEMAKKRQWQWQQQDMEDSDDGVDGGSDYKWQRERLQNHSRNAEDRCFNTK